MITYYPSELYHHGVKGQSWGVRHGPPYPVQSGAKPTLVKGKMTAKTKAEYKVNKNKVADNGDGRSLSKSMRRDRRLRMIRVSDLSDEQLKKRIDRLKLEQDYKKLLRGDAEEKKKANGGKGALKTIMQKTGEVVVPKVATMALDAYSNKRKDQRKRMEDLQDYAKEQEKRRQDRQDRREKYQDDIMREYWMDRAKRGQMFTGGLGLGSGA